MQALTSRQGHPFAAPLGWLPLLGAWLGLFHLITTCTWGHGKGTFLWLLASLVLLFVARPLGRRLGTRLVTAATGWLALAALLLLLAHLASGLRRELVRPGNATWAIDIAANTYGAGTAFLQGRNPYQEAVQRHAINPGPHVKIEGDRVLMFGVPYTYGFPYFPAMFLSYLPFRGLGAGLQSVRVGNGVIFLLILAGVFGLVRRLGPEGSPWTAAMMGVVACLGIRNLPEQLFAFGVTDLVIALYALCGFLALSRNRMLLAGILFGLCQACKLLPAPLLLLPVLVSRRGKPGFRSLAVGYAATSAALLLPFVLWSPGEFFSSTILFYLTHHQAGDDTSMWYFLPGSLKGFFTLLGIVITLALALLAGLKRREGIVAPLALGYASSITSIAFAPMSHLNYLWAIYPLGCAALAIQFATGAEESAGSGRAVPGSEAPRRPAER